MTNPITQTPTATDLERFQCIVADENARILDAILNSCPDTMLPGGRQFPLAEPDYDAKRKRELGPFAQALAGFSRTRADELDALLVAKSIPTFSS